MRFDTEKILDYLRNSDFKRLFIEELGWNNFESASVPVTVNEQLYMLHPLAEKAGAIVYLCGLCADGTLPPYDLRRKIEKQLARLIREHLIIYVDASQDNQVWQWIKREPGKPDASREQPFHKAQSGRALIQKLRALRIDMREEEDLTVSAVTGHMKDAFDLERLTKRFYDQFKVQHERFLRRIDGILVLRDREWYTSLMLNRIMFLYFLQRQGFLAEDPIYLRAKLEKMQRSLGQDRFYCHFLLPLFHEGLSKPKEQRSYEVKQLLGEVPYLNGGLFDVHELEEKNAHIQIPDVAFKDIFEFFNEYNWHLDERPLSLRKENEINPDVLGYIFEKYINQKQMGAYYTKEDITQYIVKNTVLPTLFDMVEKRVPVAFASHSSAWRLLQNDPDRYFYYEAKKGVEYPLPPDIQIGLMDARKRSQWNKAAPEMYALPTETWRDVVARRVHYEEVHAKLVDGGIRSINDLVTYNLDTYQFTQDVIETYEGSDLLMAFYESIAGRITPSGHMEKSGISILDPACGSGAFLFAALNILEVLYEACLDRMQAMVSDSDRLDELKGIHRAPGSPQSFSNFRLFLSQMEQHSNRSYFILKSIVVNNIYGVDIMAEGMEICKLRLFLKLIAQVEREEEIEALPNIDFNVCSGNTLVGITSHHQLQEAVSQKLLDKIIFQHELQEIEQGVHIVDKLTDEFRRLQLQEETHLGEVKQIKNQRRQQQKKVTEVLHRYLAGTYNITVSEQETHDEQYNMWLESHQPFYWYMDFYDIMSKGGFDVIIGNPPYVEYSGIRRSYQIKEYETEACGNIYAFMCERALQLLHPQGRMGFIVPLSLVSTERMQQLQRLLARELRTIWLSTYDVYPSKLFEGAKQRLTIFLTSATQTEHQMLSTGYNRWKTEAREALFPGLRYQQTFYDSKLSVIPKFSDSLGKAIFHKVHQKSPAPFLQKSKATPSFYVHRIPYNYVKAFNFTPYFWNEVDGEKKSEDYKPYTLDDPSDAPVMLAVLNSNLFFWWWYTLFEGYHCGKHEIHTFPIGLYTMSVEHRTQLTQLAEELMKDFKLHSTKKECVYKYTGKVIYEEFYPRRSKPIMDRIDRVLSSHYGLTEEEYDYIINYHLKYRLGQEPEMDEENVWQIMTSGSNGTKGSSGKKRVSASEQSRTLFTGQQESKLNLLD